MGAKSRNKGKSGEREVVNLAKSLGLDAVRTAPMQAGVGTQYADVDIRGIPIAVEVKRYRKTPVTSLAIPHISDPIHKLTGKIPVLAWRDDNQPFWLVGLRLDTLLAILVAARVANEEAGK